MSGKSKAEVVQDVSASEVVFMPIVVTATISVPHTYLYDIEGNTAYVREQIEELAEGLQGSVAGLEIK